MAADENPLPRSQFRINFLFELFEFLFELPDFTFKDGVVLTLLFKMFNCFDILLNLLFVGQSFQNVTP